MEYIDDKGQTVTVRPGLGDDCYIVVRVNPRTGGGHRIKSKLLSPRTTRTGAEKGLEIYAASRKWRRKPVTQHLEKEEWRSQRTAPTVECEHFLHRNEKDNFCGNIPAMGNEWCEQRGCCRDCPKSCGLKCQYSFKEEIMDKETKSPSPQPSPPKGEGESVGTAHPTGELSEAEREVLAKMDKDLMPYADGLPYDCNRVIEEAKFFLRHEVASRYEVGKRLILLRDQEGVKTYEQIIAEHFPGLSRRCSYNYILFARKIVQLPRVRDFAEGNGNFVKCLALLESFDEEDLAVLEAGGAVAGVTLDDADKMSYRELKTALREEKEKARLDKKEFAELEEKNKDLKAEIHDLRSENKTPDIHLERLKKADRHITEAVKCLVSIPDEAIKEYLDLQVKISRAITSIEQMAQNLNIKLADAVGG